MAGKAPSISIGASDLRLGIAWGGQVADLIGAHMMTLHQFPPRQKGGSLRVSAAD